MNQPGALIPKMSRLFSTPPPTNQPCEAAGMQADRPGGNRVEQGRAIPIRTGIPGVDIGEHHRCYQIADASTRGHVSLSFSSPTIPAAEIEPFMLPNWPSPKMPNTHLWLTCQS